MGELTGIARFTFHEGRAEEFTRLSAECMRIVETQDTGTLQYDIYLDDDETAAVVIERYTDEQALADHLAHIGDELMGVILATSSSVVGETLGDASDELEQRMAGGPVRVLGPHLSMRG